MKALSSAGGNGNTPPSLVEARVITAMVTPFDHSLEVDYGRAGKLARRLVDEGSDGLVVAGTTGESPTLTAGEKERLFATVVEAVGDRAWVWAGVGTNDTRASLEMLARAEAAGVRGVMLVVPYYNKPTQDGLYGHFSRLAEATDLPVMLYNVPGRTGANLLPETVERLAAHANIVALKEASGDLDQVSDLVGRLPELRVYSGDDSLTLPILAVGGVGVVSVASHVAGRALQNMIQTFRAGDTTGAAHLHLRLFPLFRALFIESNPGPVKTALRLTGFDAGPLRPPLAHPREATVRLLEEVMEGIAALRQVS